MLYDLDFSLVFSKISIWPQVSSFEALLGSPPSLELPLVCGYLSLLPCAYGKNTRILRVVLNKSWKQHPKEQHLYGHIHPISQTIHERRARHASVVRTNSFGILQLNPTYGHTSVNRSAETYIHQLCKDTGWEKT